MSADADPHAPVYNAYRRVEEEVLMAVPAGEKQERVLFSYLRYRRHCVQVVEGDEAVREFLGMKEKYKCADALGFHQGPDAPGPRRVTVAESKGNDIDSAVEQLGNAAAGVYEMFGRETAVDLLVLIPTLVEKLGSMSPGGGYRVTPRDTGLNKFILEEWRGGPSVQARPKLTYPKWASWDSKVYSLPITVLKAEGLRFP